MFILHPRWRGGEVCRSRYVFTSVRAFRTHAKGRAHYLPSEFIKCYIKIKTLGRKKFLLHHHNKLGNVKAILAKQPEVKISFSKYKILIISDFLFKIPHIKKRFLYGLNRCSTVCVCVRTVLEISLTSTFPLADTLG